MRNLRMSWFVTINVLVFISAFCNLSEAKLGQKLPFAVIVGTVYCETCFQAALSKPTHFIAGALVGVECLGTGTHPGFERQVKTNAKGKFVVHLPFSVSKHLKRIQSCSVKLIKSSEPYCSIASSATQSSLHLKAKSTRTHIFSAGYFTFKPSDQPNICNQKPTKSFNSRKFLPLNPTEPSPVQSPLIPNLPPTDQSFLPPLPALPRIPPLPQLPPLPSLPNLPLLPPSDKKIVKPKTKNDLENMEYPKNQESISSVQLSDKKLERQTTKKDLEKMKLPKNQELPSSVQLSDKKLKKPKTKNDLENLEFPNDQQLTPNPQLSTVSSPPPLFGFQLPPFGMRPPPLNLPPNPFQQSPPLGNIGNTPNLNAPPVLPLPSAPALTNPLPTFPFQPSPGLPGFPPATERESP